MASLDTLMTLRKKLPIGIQTFSQIREQGYYYVDKTQLALNLINDGKHNFLSRPRRFGKSLLIDTLKELFEGNEALFKGLAAEQQWDWTVKHPVLRFSFGKGHYDSVEYLHKNLMAQLDQLDQQFHHHSVYDTTPERLSSLIRHVKTVTQQNVVLLIDEYDKPILDTLRHAEVSRTCRDYLRGFYSTIKDADSEIAFSLLTGVSKFSRVSLFSGLNNLKDLTLDPRYSTLCGYTDNDIDTVFAPELFELDRAAIRDWYNGYHWLGEGVYNPFDILQLFDNRTFKNYWFETGTPTFLVDTLFERQIASLQLTDMFSSSSMLSSFDVDSMAIEALLFQTGYLTIKGTEDLAGQTYYRLGYPNREVYQSLNEHLLYRLVQDQSQQARQVGQLYRLLKANDFEGMKQLFHAFFASIPYAWYTHGSIQSYEGYYASVFYSYFAALGLDIKVEDMTNLGRIDMTLHFNDYVYIFEFKVIENAGEGAALAQLRNKQYADQYRALQQPIYLIGVEFSKVSRNIETFEVEQVGEPTDPC